MVVPHMLGVLLWGLFKLIKYLAVGIGHGAFGIGRVAGGGAVNVGRFMIMGHHSVKNRTCPKIEIVKVDA